MSGDGRMNSRIYLHVEEPETLKEYLVNTIYSADLIEDSQPIIICDILSCYFAQNQDEEAADLTLYTYDKKVKIQVLIENCLVISKLNQTKNKLKEAHMHGWFVNLTKPAIDIKISYYESVSAYSVQFVLTCEDYEKKYLGDSDVMRKIQETQGEYNFVENEWKEEIVSLVERFNIIQIAIEKIKKNQFFGWSNIEDFFENNDYLLIKDINHEIEKRSRTEVHEYQLKMPQILLNKDSSKHVHYERSKGIERNNKNKIPRSSIFLNNFNSYIGLSSSFSFDYPICPQQELFIKQEMPNIIKSVNSIKIKNDSEYNENVENIENYNFNTDFNIHNSNKLGGFLNKVSYKDQDIREFTPIINHNASNVKLNNCENTLTQTQNINFSTVGSVKKETNIKNVNDNKHILTNNKTDFDIEDTAIKVESEGSNNNHAKNVTNSISNLTKLQSTSDKKDKDFDNIIKDWVLTGFSNSNTEKKQRNPYIPNSDSEEHLDVPHNNLIIPNTNTNTNTNTKSISVEKVAHNDKTSHVDEEANFSFGDNCDQVNKDFNSSQISNRNSNRDLYSYQEAQSEFGSAIKSNIDSYITTNVNNQTPTNKRFSNKDNLPSPHDINKLHLGKDIARFCEENAEKLKNLTHEDLRLFIIFSKRIKAEIESCDKLSKH